GGHRGERAGPLAGARGDEAGDAAFIGREVRADGVLEDGPRVVRAERTGILDLGAQAGIPGERAARGAAAQLQEELAGAVVVAVVAAREEVRERVAERVADPLLVGDRDVASAQHDRGSGPLEREVEAAAQRAALRAVRDLAVDAGLEAGDVRWQVRGAPAHGEAAD